MVSRMIKIVASKSERWLLNRLVGGRISLLPSPPHRPTWFWRPSRNRAELFSSGAMYAALMITSCRITTHLIVLQWAWTVTLGMGTAMFWSKTSTSELEQVPHLCTYCRPTPLVSWSTDERLHQPIKVCSWDFDAPVERHTPVRRLSL